MEKTIKNFLGKGPEKNPAAKKSPAPPKPHGRRVYLVHNPGSVQTQILAGCHAITRKHPDWIRLGLTNSLYGGAFNSRLVMNIREDKGYTYSPRSSVYPQRQHGYFSVSAAVRNDVVAASLTEILYELAADYLETYRGKIRAITPADLMATARKYFDSANMQIVVVGDRAQIESQAALFGDLTIFDSQGNQL